MPAWIVNRRTAAAVEEFSSTHPSFAATALTYSWPVFVIGLFALVGWRLGGGPQSTTMAAKLFIPIWLAIALINMWLGVSRAGYSVAEELPIMLVIFAIPAAAAALLWWRFSWKRGAQR